MKGKNSLEFYGDKHILQAKLTSKSVTLDLITILEGARSRRFFVQISTQSSALLSQFGTVKQLFHFLSNEKNFQVDCHQGVVILKWSVNGFDFERMVTHRIELQALVLSEEQRLECEVSIYKKKIEMVRVAIEKGRMDEQGHENSKQQSRKGSSLGSEFQAKPVEKESKNCGEQKGLKQKQSISNKRNVNTLGQSEMGCEHEKKDDLVKADVNVPEQSRISQVQKHAKIGQRESCQKQNEKMQQQNEAIGTIEKTPKKRGRPPKLNKIIQKDKYKKKEKQNGLSKNQRNQIGLCSNVQKGKQAIPIEEEQGVKQIQKEKNFEKMQTEGNQVKILYKSGDTYEGEMNNRAYQGYGVYTCKDQRRYEGFWLKGLYHGKGAQIFPDGTRFLGNFESDVRVGEGEDIYSNGDRFVGNFTNGVKDGFGKYYYHNGDIYEGQFRNDVAHGHGTELMNDGSQFEGTWQDGKRHGEGTIRYKNNKNFFRQSWQNGVLIRRKNIKGSLGMTRIKQKDDEDNQQL